MYTRNMALIRVYMQNLICVNSADPARGKDCE